MYRAFNNAIKRTTGIYYLVFWLLTVGLLVGAQEVLASCMSASGEAAVIACRQELNRTPRNLDIRFALSDALIALRRHKEAVEVLQQGLERSPGNDQIKKKLSLAESYLDEQLWIEKRRAQQAAPAGATASKKHDTDTKLNIIRCTKLKGHSALKACNMVLKVFPNDPSLHRSKADALMDMDQVVEAITAYRESLSFAPHDAETSKKLSTAQSKRKSIAADCKRLIGFAALNACDAALLVGERDEFVIQNRRGDILLGMKRKAEAKKAYRNALKLSPNDHLISKKLSSLMKPKASTKVDNTSRPRRRSKPQEAVTAQQPAAAPAPLEPKKQVRETQVPILSAKHAEERDTSPIATFTPLFVSPEQKRYSNRPPVAGITH